jgi:hypothetical protein
MKASTQNLQSLKALTAASRTSQIATVRAAPPAVPSSGRLKNRLFVSSTVAGAFLLVFVANTCPADDFPGRTFGDTKKLITTVNAGSQLTYSWDESSYADCDHTESDSSAPSGSDTWDVENVDTPLNVTKSANSQVPHPTKAFAVSQFSAQSSKVGAQYKVQGSLTGRVGVYASALADKAVPEDTATALAQLTMARMSVGQKSISIHDLSGGAQITTTKTGTPTAVKGNTRHAVKYLDPVSVTLLEVETGQAYSQELLSINIEMEDYGNGLLIYDNEVGGGGVLMSCDADESLRIYGCSQSDWLLASYGAFSASLSGGKFEATGVWASLPWQLTYQDPADPASTVLSASLSASYLLTELQWQIPETLMREGYTYDLDLSWSDSGQMEAIDVDVIPEPTTIGLLGLGWLCLLRKQGRLL